LEGHGVFPDKEIVPTLEDKIKDIDVEMNWVLEDLKKNQLNGIKNEKNRRKFF
jgi:hypothetical protein